MNDSPPTQGRRQITLISFVLVSFVCAMTAVGARYLGETLVADTVSARATFAISVTMLPMLSLIATNLFYGATRWRK